MCSNSSHTERYWDIRILKPLSTTLVRILPKLYEKARVSTYSSLLKVTDRRKQGFNYHSVTLGHLSHKPEQLSNVGVWQRTEIYLLWKVQISALSPSDTSCLQHEGDTSHQGILKSQLSVVSSHSPQIYLLWHF